MSLSIRAMFRIAFRLIHKTDFFFGSQNHTFELQTALPQQFQRIIRHGAGDSLGRQIENPLSHVSAHGLDCRKKCRNCLSDARRGLQKQFFPMINRLIHIGHQLSLALSVRIRKLQLFYGFLPDFSPFPTVIRPLAIRRKQLCKPLFQLFKGIIFIEIANLLRLNIAVCHTDLNFSARLRQSLLLRLYLQISLICFFAQRIHVCIALCLGYMHGNGLFHTVHIPIGSLYLIDRDAFPVINDPVSPSLHDQSVLLCIQRVLQRHFRLIIRAHPTLYHAMDPASLLHGIFMQSLMPIVNISLSQDKLNQPSDGYAHFPRKAFSPYLPIISRLRIFSYPRRLFRAIHMLRPIH